MTGRPAEIQPPPRRFGRGILRAALALVATAPIFWATGLTGPAAGASSPLLLAELPEGFDDYSPPSRTEQLPPEGGQDGGNGGGSTGGGTTGGGSTGGGTTSGGTKLTVQHILGNWCSATSNYVIGRKQLVVILPDRNSRSTYKVVAIDVTGSTVIVRWITSDKRRVRTTFGRFSADGKQMVQLAANRVYRRCKIAGTKPLGYGDILGSWCDANSKYIITRSQLTVVFTGGRRVTYKITGFRFLNDVVEMLWTNSGGKTSRTRFGRYAADRQTMVQLGVNRTYSRC